MGDTPGYSVVVTNGLNQFELLGDPATEGAIDRVEARIIIAMLDEARDRLQKIVWPNPTFGPDGPGPF